MNVDLSEARTRWPTFTPAALEAGFGSTHALPMRLRGNIIGALNLFTVTTAHLSDDDVAVGQAMADVATIGLLHQRSLHEQTSCPSSSRPPSRAGSWSSRPRASWPPARA